MVAFCTPLICNNSFLKVTAWFPSASGMIDGQNLVAIKPNVFLVDIIKLVVNNNSSENKNDRNNKLENNQRIAQP